MANPEFIRLPKTGERCPHTGLSRTELNCLILPNAKNGHRPPVASVCLRKRGALRGTRLIIFDSLISYLHSLSTRQATAPRDDQRTALVHKWRSFRRERVRHPAQPPPEFRTDWDYLPDSADDPAA